MSTVNIGLIHDLGNQAVPMIMAKSRPRQMANMVRWSLACEAAKRYRAVRDVMVEVMSSGESWRFVSVVVCVSPGLLASA